jgi:hypothetical protein
LETGRAAKLCEVPILLNGAIFRSNQYHAEATCEHCSGVIRHESWFITRNSLVYYAYQTVMDPQKLTLADHLILHALGVAWASNRCARSCPPA